MPLNYLVQAYVFISEQNSYGDHKIYNIDPFKSTNTGFVEIDTWISLSCYMDLSSCCRYLLPSPKPSLAEDFEVWSAVKEWARSKWTGFLLMLQISNCSPCTNPHRYFLHFLCMLPLLRCLLSKSYEAACLWSSISCVYNFFTGFMWFLRLSCVSFS